MMGDLVFGVRIENSSSGIGEIKSARDEYAALQKQTDALAESSGRMASSYSGLTSSVKEHSAAVTLTEGKVSKLLDRYDPMGAKLRQLQADFKALDQAAAGGKIAGRDDSRVDQVYSNLQKEIAVAQAATLTFGATTSQGMQGLGLNSQYARREMMQLGKEALTGDFSRMPATFSSLATHSRLLPALFSPVGAAVAGVTALAVAGGAAWYYWGREAESAADKAVGGARKVLDGMKETDAVYLLQREREKLAKKVPITWLQYDDKDLKKLDEESQKLISEIKSIDKKIQTETKRSEQSWGVMYATPQEKKDSELKNLKQLYDEQLVLHKGNKQELLKVEQQYLQKKNALNEQYSSKEDNAALKSKHESLQLLIGLEKQYSNELAKRNEAMAAPLMSANELKFTDDMRQVEKLAQDARIKAEERNIQGTLSAADYHKSLQLITADEMGQKQAVAALDLEQEKLNGKWEYGAQIAMRKYTDAAVNTARQSEQVFASSFKSMEDQEVSFIRKGKADWASFGDTIINELIRIQIAKANAGVMGMLSGTFGNGAVGEVGNSSVDYTGGYAPNAKGNVFGFANGGAFTNQLFDSPTAFRFANGGGFSPGVMGEAGPEAVMPLSRDSNGKLGVRSQGGGNTVTIQNYINAKTGETKTSASSNDQDLNKLGNRIADVSRRVILDEMRPGGLLARAR